MWHTYLRRALVIGAGLVLFVGPMDVTPISAAAGDGTGSGARSAEVVPGSYIVVLADTGARVAEEATRLTAAYGGRVTDVFAPTLAGFAVTMDEQQAGRMAADARVDYVERDQIAQTTGVQLNPPWGLDRIDQPTWPLDQTYHFPQPRAGERRVEIFIIDTGVRFTHQTFGGRAKPGIDVVGDGMNGNDCHGHGTHVAGTAAGFAFGVAKYATLISVRVLDCLGFGTTSKVISGVNFVTQSAGGHGVANMSLGMPFSPALLTAVTNSINAGTVYAVAAGNDGSSACIQSPANTPAAITVGATNILEQRALFSNFGACLDLFAPGEGIISAGHGSDGAQAMKSGTSMASPHVAGAAALYRARFPAHTPAQVHDALVTNASVGVVGNAGPASPNRLLFMDFLPL